MSTVDPAVVPGDFPESRARSFPPMPTSIKETGLTEEAIADLLLKALYVGGARTGQVLAEYLCIPFSILDNIILSLQQRRLMEVRGASGHNRASYVFDATGAGRERAKEALESNQYVGPVPVPLNYYREWIERQTIRNVRVNREAVANGFANMVIDEELFETLGPAINSAKSLFLYGDPGNGKTMIAESIANMLGGEIFVPYAVDIGGQTMVVYDPVYHRPVEDQQTSVNSIWRRAELEHDRRFARVRRPVVMVGGELTLAQLDLQYDAHTKMYQAPFQVKANGGLLIIDDFGRQRVEPRELLNRWIVPLEKRIDFLSLHTGNKFPVPFDCLLIFATNLDPTDLVEEAFLRRIHYKVHVKSPTRPQYEEIFKRVAKAMNVPYDVRGIDFIYHEYYGRRGFRPRACHPRDILEHVCDTARFMDVPPTLDLDLLKHASDSYFLDAAEFARE